MIRTSLRDQVRQHLRRELIHGNLPPGTQLTLQQLAKRLSVSPTPTREALGQLEKEGLVRLESNRGFFVAPVTLQEARDLYPLLAELEGLAIELTGSLPVERFDRLRELNTSMEAQVGRPFALFECDLQWHETLVEGCPNALVLQHLQSVRNRAERYERAYMAHSGTVPFSTQDHRRIIEALEHDLSEARALLRAHWERSSSFVNDWLSREGAAQEEAS